MLERMISLFLCAFMLASMLPAQAIALEMDEDPVELFLEEEIELTEGESEPAEEETEPAEEETEPAENPAVPGEKESEATEEQLPLGELAQEPMLTDGSVIANGICGDDLSWTLYGNGTLAISGTGDMYDYTHDSQNKSPWHAYLGETRIKEIQLGNGITSIGNAAFFGSEITGIIIPDGVTRIGDYAFYLCAMLENLTIPDSVTTIGDWSFASCPYLRQIAFSKNVTVIGDYSFANCNINLTSITLPDGLLEIGKLAFDGCDQLRSIRIPDSVTTIGDHAFEECKSLLSIVIPENVTVLNNGLFSGCISLGSVTLMEGLQEISTLVFTGCNSLTEIVIPESVVEIAPATFSDSGLKEIYFKGSAPDTRGAFFGLTATVYYPRDYISWTEEVMEKLGDRATITWKPYTPFAEPEQACSLAELKTIDYLAFSQAAYRNFTDNKTLMQCLKEQEYWNRVWGEDGITYAQLCEKIAEWEVLCQLDNTSNNGFYAVAFQNQQDEVVISYRGSKPLDEMWDDDTWNDWAVTDIPMQVFKTTNGVSQYLDAFKFYDTVMSKGNWKEVHVTGHSLGGALAYIVSARYGCRGITMNSISIFDPIYESEYAVMGENFWGVNVWNFMDHVNVGDSLAGMWEYYQTNGENVLKPFTSYSSNYEVHDPFLVGFNNAANHGLKSFVSKSGNNVILNTVDQTFVRDNTYVSYKVLDTFGKGPHVYRTLVLGTTGSDSHQSADYEGKGYFFGGEGPDTFNGYNNDDVLIGGPGADKLDGGRDDDLYIYYKGDGVDFIWDNEGDDELHLYGFSASDSIEVYKESADAEYLHILYNGDPIVRIYTKGRTYKNINWGSDEFVIKVMQGDEVRKEFDITEYFSTKKYTQNLKISCPVNVEILDAYGNVVYTLVDGEVGSYYSDCGNFYIYEEESGEFGKMIDLVEGYSVRILGADEGTMDISYRNIEEGVISEIENTLINVPVSVDFSATIEKNEEGTSILSADTDGDSIIDQEEIFQETILHSYVCVVTEPTCTEMGFSTYTCDCGDSFVDSYVDALGHDYQEGVCSRCGSEKIIEAENRLIMDVENIGDQKTIWIDGKEYIWKTDGYISYVDLPNGEAKTMVVYTYGESNGKPYPT